MPVICAMDKCGMHVVWSHRMLCRAVCASNSRVFCVQLTCNLCTRRTLPHIMRFTSLIMLLCCWASEAGWLRTNCRRNISLTVVVYYMQIIRVDARTGHARSSVGTRADCMHSLRALVGMRCALPPPSRSSPLTGATASRRRLRRQHANHAYYIKTHTAASALGRCSLISLSSRPFRLCPMRGGGPSEKLFNFE